MLGIELSEAIEASDRAYGLLIWLGDLVNDDRVSPADVRKILSAPAAAEAFLLAHDASVPSGLRPNARERPATAFILGSYLTVSFDLADEITHEARPDPSCGPGCPWCWHVERKPHLTTKKLTKTEKQRAQSIMESAVHTRAESVQPESVESAVGVVLAEHSREVATVAYADELIRRASGQRSGLWALALWRQMAWAGGSPRKGFAFTVDFVVAAEENLRTALLAQAY